MGRRTLRVMDFGKVAATFVDTYTGHAVRIVPQGHAGRLAQALAPAA
jgi:formylmethanofuran dehydrogenase subunit E